MLFAMKTDQGGPEPQEIHRRLSRKSYISGNRIQRRNPKTQIPLYNRGIVNADPLRGAPRADSAFCTVCAGFPIPMIPSKRFPTPARSVPADLLSPSLYTSSKISPLAMPSPQGSAGKSLGFLSESHQEPQFFQKYRHPVFTFWGPRIWE